MATQDPLPGNAAVPVLLDFLSSVPYQLTAALVRLGPYISALRQLAEVTSWSTSWYGPAGLPSLPGGHSVYCWSSLCSTLLLILSRLIV